jgi:LPS-assembly lipoprotein
MLGALGVGALALSGCQVSPLYGDRSLAVGGRSATATALSAIVIDEPADRTTQLVRNELFFGLGSGTVAPQYRLALRAASATQTLGVGGTGAAFARTVRVTASYQLFGLGAAPLAENTVISTASYDSVDQRFANQRAAIDAEARAARDVARVIEAQLAAVFAQGL